MEQVAPCTPLSDANCTSCADGIFKSTPGSAPCERQPQCDPDTTVVEVDGTKRAARTRPGLAWVPAPSTFRFSMFARIENEPLVAMRSSLGCDDAFLPSKRLNGQKENDIFDAVCAVRWSALPRALPPSLASPR